MCAAKISDEPAQGLARLASGIAALVLCSVMPAAAQSLAIFSIQAGSLDQALASFGAQSGEQVIYDSALTKGKTAPALSGAMPPSAALQRLLAGSGLAARATGPHAVSLDPLPASTADSMTLPTVQVEGQGGPSQSVIGNLAPAYAGGQVATGGQLGLLGNRDIMDTPFSQTNYTQQTLKDQQVRVVTDALDNNPSARNTWSNDSYTSALYIRGFAVSPWDFSLNGLFGVVPGLAFSADSVERIEVLNGPSALLNGMPPLGSVGGVVNLVTKRATDDPITQLTTTYATRSQFGTQIDIGRRYGDNHEWGVRFNGTYRNGDTPTDHQSQMLGDANLGLDYRGQRLRVSLDLGFQDQTLESPLRPTYLATGIAVPKAPSATSNWFQPWTYAHAKDWYGALHAEYDLTDNWTLSGAVGGRQNRSYLLSGFATITNAKGDLTEAPYNFPVYHDSDSQQAALRGRFDTYWINHQVAFTADRVHDQSGSQFPVAVSIASNLYAPNFIGEPAYSQLSAPMTSDTQLESAGFADTMSVLDTRINLIWGLREQQVTTSNYSSTTGALTAHYSSSALTPTVGAVLKPWQNVSLYASYIEGLQAGTTVGAAYANSGDTLPPFISKQIETGVKADWGQFTTTLALFQITQQSGSGDPKTLIYSADGEQRNRGIEINTFGRLTDAVRVLGGVTFLQGRLTSTAGGTNNGKTAPGVPDVQMNMGAEWDAPFIQGLTLSGRAIYTSSQYYDNANTQQIPGWVRFDLGARYTFDVRGQPITIRGNVINVANTNYWAAANPTYGLSLGTPRTFLVSTSINF